MPLGNTMMGPQQQQQIHPALAQSMAPQAVASQAQPGFAGRIGDVLTRLQNNPAAIEMLLQSGAQLLNPTTYQSSMGRISQAASDGISGYNDLKAEEEATEFQRDTINRREDRADRGENRADRGADLNERKVDLTEQQMGTADEQWTQEFGLKSDQLEAQKKLWEAQAAKYRAGAEALREKATVQGPDSLTGPERIINNLATVFQANGVPADRAYTMSFDIYNKADESKAKAITGVYESLGMLGSTTKGKELLDQIVEQIDQNFQSGTERLEGVKAQGQNPQTNATGAAPIEIAPNVSSADVQQALSAINQNDGTQLTWEALNEQQRDRLIQVIQQRKGAPQ